MTKIVKTIDKVTNHENMRRYLHKKASKGSGGTVTADSITPEILEDEDAWKKIRNWGLSDEEISHLHTIKFEVDAISYDEDLSSHLSSNDDTFISLWFDGEEIPAGNALINFCGSFLLNPPEYLLYTQESASTGVVFKKVFTFNTGVMYSAIQGADISFLNNGSIESSVGIDTF